MTYTYRKHMLVINMDPFIISTQGVSPRVVIWPMEKQDSLRNMVLIAMGIPQSAASTIRDVLEKGRHEVELV